MIQKGKNSDLLKDPLYHFIAAAAHADEEEKMRQENQQRRVDLLEWVRSKPGPRLLRMALCMQPAARFMQVQLQYGSAEHDKKVLLQSALQKDGGLLHASVAAASGAYTTVFWDELGQAWTSPDYWKATPQRTRENLARSFAMLARNGGGVHYLVTAVHEKHFWRLLKLLALDTPSSFADEIHADPPCMLDKFAELFLQMFDTPAKLRSPLARAMLWTLARVLRVDTMPLECRFAFLRNISVLGSECSKSRGFESAASTFLLSEQRVKESAPGLQPAFKGDQQEGEEASTRKVVGGGGAWRTWCSQSLRESSGSQEPTHWESMAKEYI